MPDNEQLTQCDLAARIQDNEPGAFEELVRTYQADVRIMTRRHLGRTAAAEEVAQEVFVQLFGSIGGFRGDSSLKTWIRSVTRNQIRLHLRNETRRLRRTATVVSPELLESEQALHDHDPFRLASAESELDALRNCLEQLGERPGKIVHDFYFQRRSAESIAADQRQSAGAIRMLLMRVRKRLGECIRSQIPDHEKALP
ncbi:MAG: sigma-70 family RNA polymerase sigma factor [Planctomycetaceae bacterium]|nr:sigma-70 family RNA polymerase sigma factor [Planctomycetaceae bacterium]